MSVSLVACTLFYVSTDVPLVHPTKEQRRWRMARSLPDFYYDFDNNFYYDYIGTRGSRSGRFQQLRMEAINHFNAINLPYTRTNYQKTAAHLRTLAQRERDKENKLLNDVYVKKGDLDIATLTDRQLVQLMTDAMSIRGVWDRTLKAIDGNKPALLRDNKYRMEKYLYQNVVKDILHDNARKIAREIGGYVQQGIKNGDLDKRELEDKMREVTEPYFKQAIDKMVDDLAKDTKDNKALQGYKDLKKAKDELQEYYDKWVREVGEQMFTDLGFLQDLDSLIKDVGENSKNIRGATTRTANWLDINVLATIKNTRKVAQRAGLLSEVSASLLPELTNTVNEALEKFDIHSTNVGRQGTVDGLQFWTPKNGTIAEVDGKIGIDVEKIEEYLKGSDKRAAREGYAKFFEEARREAAENKELYAHSYFIRSNNKDYNLSKKGSFQGGQQRLTDDLGTIFGTNNLSGVYGLLANTAPGGLMHGTDKHEDLLVSLGAHIGNFLFDDYTEIGRQGDLNVIHVLNLNKNIIPLSVFLFGLAQAFESANSEVSQVYVQALGNASKVEIGNIASATVTHPAIDTSIRGGQPAWASQAARAYQNIDVQLTFYKNFMDIVKEWI